MRFGRVSIWLLVAALGTALDAQQAATSVEELEVARVLRNALAKTIAEGPDQLAPADLGVRLNRVTVDRTSETGRRITIDLSQRALTVSRERDFDVLAEHLIADTSLWTASFTSVDFIFLIDGVPLDQLRPLVRERGVSNDRAVGVKNRIAISAGHGWYYQESTGRWALQRPLTLGIQEDFVNWEITKYLHDELSAAGFDVRSARFPNRTNEIGSTGHPRWEEAGKYYIKDLGAPAATWNTGSNDYNKDINSRPLYANWVDAAALVSIHNNAGGGTGTETWWDNSNPHQNESRKLAEIVNAKVVAAIKARHDPNWRDRGLKSCNCLGENSVATRPAIIVEIAFMDRQSPDNDALHKDGFKRLVARAILEGIQEWSGAGTDTIAPSVTSFHTSATSLRSGESLTLSFTATDSGGSGLNRAELFRRTDGGNWVLLRQSIANGNGPFSGTFVDAPPNGTHWYGVHVVDGAGNRGVEPNPPGPIRVTVESGRDTIAPTVTSFRASATSIRSGDSVTLNYTVTDSGGAGLSRVELWRAAEGGSWVLLRQSSASGNGPFSGTFVDSPLNGAHWYGVHVIDGAGNRGVEPNPPGPIRVTVESGRDTIAPTVTSFRASATSIRSGESLTFNYTVTDSGGSGLNRVELWRRPDGGEWLLVRQSSAGGNGPFSGTVVDAPPNGAHSYGVHVVDGAGNRGVEPNPPGPIRVTVDNGRDTIAPTVTSFRTSATSLRSGESLTLNYTVTDSGGSGLNRIEMWRAVEGGSWVLLRQSTASGNGPFSGTFIDSPPNGAHWYGVHVVDGAGNRGVEPNPPGPIRVTVDSGKRDTTAPSVTSFRASATSLRSGESLSLDYTVTDSGDSGLNRVELWRRLDGGDWVLLRQSSANGHGPFSGTFVDSPPNGAYWYGAHVIDGAGNRGFEPNPPGPIRVTVGTTSGGSGELDTQARRDMVARATRDNRFGAAIESTFGSDLNWDPNWTLRWLDFRFTQNRTVRMLHATFRNDPTVRYIAFTDPDTSTWRDWERVLP